MSYDLSKIKTMVFSNSSPYGLGEDINDFIKDAVEPGRYEYIDLKIQSWSGNYRAVLVYAETENKNEL